MTLLRRILSLFRKRRSKFIPMNLGESLLSRCSKAHIRRTTLGKRR